MKIRRIRRITKKLTPYLLLLPIFILLSIFLLYPSAQNIFFSLYDFHLLRPEKASYVGFRNYISALLDPKVIDSLRITLTFSLSAVLFEFLIGLSVALLLDRKWRGAAAIQLIVIIPLIIMPIVVGLMFRFLWNTDWGLINYLLTWIGVPMGKINWLGDPSTALFAVIVTEIWNNTPFVILVLFAALRSLPVVPFESAMVDGASRWQMFVYITLPLLTPAIAVVLTFRTIYALRQFATIYALTAGGPGYSTSVLSVFIYYTGFRYYQVGYSGALSVILLCVTVAFGLFYFKWLYGKLEM